MTLAKIGRRLSERARELQQVLPVLTALGIFYFASFTGWAVIDFADYQASSRPWARMTGPLLLILGACIFGLGALVHRLGYGLLGVAIILFAIGNGLTIVRLGGGWTRQLVVGILIMSVMIALASFAVQIRDRRRTSRV